MQTMPPTGSRILTDAQRKLVATIKRLHATGEPLNISHVRYKYRELIRAVYRIKPFWG